MDSSPTGTSKALEPSLPTTAGVKRPAPSLLPAFEPFSSSPGLPRPTKRQATSTAFLKYPTPIPTSSTGILSSSPPRVGARPALQRTQSIVSERAPLCDVRTVELNENGEVLLMGRSSNSTHYQLSANRLISRIHVKARYIAATEALEPNKIEVICDGWNGMKLHCDGQTWELAKGDSFTSETEGAEIMVDVQDARVFLQWPRRDKEREALGNLSDSSWDESPRPAGRASSNLLQGSPLRRTVRLASPVSPSPANVSTSNASLEDLLPGGIDPEAEVQIYEDGSSDEQELPKLPESSVPEASFMTQAAESFSSELSDPQSDGENDPDEENDPVVHSFGPFGANLSGRFASFSTFSPKLPQGARLSMPGRATALEPLNEHSPNASPKTAITAAVALAAIVEEPVTNPLNETETAAVTNHVINQLAFSRLSSTPLSTIMSKIPAETKKDLEKEQLRVIIESTPCLGIIRRQGKDAAGKPLESEYYYIPEMDTDEQRRLAVTDGLRKPSLRNCRKQHKVSHAPTPKVV
ncbi:hypothetical protein B0T16DRAFT_332326 [Cercophora newfieldiana]|uniref:FHA domain-containing protein n=1 Tax=Cercophora newfieldiana TaxID=92897 RepID=A0AA39Y0S4_9PEZI|nr:hypothetical protein B0T16DRAFT_332326 [Cercophora newfieldiana]